MSVLAAAIEATLRVTATFESLAIPYLVGGSLASSLQGIPRATQDVDLVAMMRDEHVTPFVTALGDEFYADADMIRDAIGRRSEFNLIHQPTVFKVDVFVPPFDLVVRRELARAKRFALDATHSLMVASPEDVVVQKLRWYRLGGDVSERQWGDAVGVVKTHLQKLDVSYMRETADALNVPDLLARLLSETGIG